MAGLTKEQRAEREKQKLAEQQALELANAQNVIATSTAESATPPGNVATVSQQPALTDGGDNEGGKATSNSATSLNAGAEETVLMVRSDPDHPGGPVEADVHAGEVERWKEFGWTVDVQED